jgi:hypothetical protein
LLAGLLTIAAAFSPLGIHVVRQFAQHAVKVPLFAHAAPCLRK